MDEPTTALDVVVQREILGQILELKETLDFAILFITHDLRVAAQLCDRVIVIAQGKILADAPPSDLTRLMQLPSLEKVFAQLVRQQDTRAAAHNMVEAMRMGNA